MHAESGWRPATSGERYPVIDILRGLALFGVLMVNLLTLFRLPLLEHILRPRADPGLANQAVDLLVAGALEFKAVTIFSFLFGVGIAIQSERAAASHVSARRFLAQRFLWLLLLGTIHLFFIWDGDILALFAVCGLLLVPFIGLPWPALVLIGVAVMAIPRVASIDLPFPSGPAAAALIEQARSVYATGGFLAIQRFRFHEAVELIVPLLNAILPRTAGLMLWGMAAWRSGILREPENHRRKLVAVFFVSAAAAIVFTAIDPRMGAPFPLALAYTSGLLLSITPARAPAWAPFAAVGRMALTNYLLQSIVLGFIFYGYGLGLFGRLGSAAAACIGVALYAAQMATSVWWLRRFRFGPFEWLWRSLTYGHAQPMRLPSGAILVP